MKVIKGIDKGIYLNIDQYYLKYQSNLLTGKKEKEEKQKNELNLFFRIWVKGIQNKKRKKEIQFEMAEAFKSNGFKFSRSKFFRLQEKFYLKDIVRETNKIYEADKKRRMNKQQFEIAISSPSCKPSSFEEQAMRIKPDIESHSKEKGDKIRKGIKKGSHNGGQSTKEKYI